MKFLTLFSQKKKLKNSMLSAAVVTDNLSIKSCTEANPIMTYSHVIVFEYI